MPFTWTIEYTETARTQLRKLDTARARRIVEYMTTRVAGLEDPRRLGKARRWCMNRNWPATILT